MVAVEVLQKPENQHMHLNQSPYYFQNLNDKNFSQNQPTPHYQSTNNQATFSASPSPQFFSDKTYLNPVASKITYIKPKKMTGFQSACDLYLSNTEGRWLDNTQGYSSVEILAGTPFCKNNSLFTFFDVKGHFFNNGKIAANAGLGVRYKRCDSLNIFGFNTFYDYRKTRSNHEYQEVGFGFEYLFPNFDVRLNAYIPVGNKKGGKFTSYSYNRGSTSYNENEKIACTGLDLMIGSWLKKQTPCNPFDCYAALGYYYYTQRKHFHNDYGVKAKIQAHFLKHLALEIQGGYDNVYHGMVQGTISFAIPLDYLLDRSCKEKSHYLYQQIQRQEIIVLSKRRHF